jgi:hypothetical protein
VQRRRRRRRAQRRRARAAATRRRLLLLIALQALLCLCGLLSWSQAEANASRAPRIDGVGGGGPIAAKEGCGEGEASGGGRQQRLLL